MRRAARVDVNQVEIVEALRAAGATVQSLAAVGCGCPDLLVGFRTQSLLMEVKHGRNGLTPEQVVWHQAWRGGPLAIVRDVDAALRALGVMAR